ncbi:MAG: MerR family transcriptional regulator [Lachnospiraceae bacterium]|nr:MerR family transcriptional regulator [Lachnospiraceae bacterium]
MRETKENGQVLYSVSEAVRETGVPSHVLRYWEDELGLEIRRTAQGHRIYSEEDLAVFRKVKDLKEKGIQLKAIRLLLEKSGEGTQLSELLGQGLYERQETTAEEREITAAKQETAAVNRGLNEQLEQTEPAGGVEYEVLPKSETGTYQLFETMLRSLISEEVAGQNEKLEAELADLIRDEIEELYIQLRRDPGEEEAAAAQMQRTGRAVTGGCRESLLRRIKRFFLPGPAHKKRGGCSPPQNA